MNESKFAGLKDLKSEKGQGAKAQRPAPAKAVSTAVLTPKERNLTGKRSHPDWKQRSVLLKNGSFDEAHDILKRKYNGRDFSELMQALLDQWLHTERAQ